MDPSTSSITNLGIGAVVGMASKILMMLGFTGQFASVLTMIVVLGIVGLFAYTHENHYERIMLWNYLVMWLDLNVAAIAGFHVTEEAVKAAKRNDLM